MVYKRANSKYWWYRFEFDGKTYCKSTKLTNKQDARNIEANQKGLLVRGEFGIFDRKEMPTLAQFIEKEFLPFIENTAKPNTKRFYCYHADVLRWSHALATIPMDEITPNLIAEHVAARRKAGCEVSTCNRDLGTLRRIFALATEWGKAWGLPKVRMLSGENRRERVITAKEEAAYLKAAAPLLKDVGTLLFDLGLRPEECFRLQRENYRDGYVTIMSGKGRGSRRRIPCSKRAIKILARRLKDQEANWVFPAPTKTGHIDGSSVKKQHAAALKAAGVTPWVLYSIRHTAITRWSKLIDAFTLHHVAGHISMSTTQRYVHTDDASLRKILGE